MPLVGQISFSLRLPLYERKVRDLRRSGGPRHHRNSMTHAFHIASSIPSRKRDAGLCMRDLCVEALRMALLPACGKRNQFGNTTID